MKLFNLQGRAYPIFVNTTLNRKISEDGTLDFEIIENEKNYDVIASLTKMWTVTEVAGKQDTRVYRIVLLDKTSIGEKLKVTVKAREREIDDLQNKRIYEVYNGSFTATKFFDLVFKGTGYKYKLTHKVNSSKFEGLGDGESNLDIFKKGLERFGLEYEYNENTKTFTLLPSINNKPKYFLDSKTNANNVRIEEDATKCYTYIRGYGDYTGEQTYLEGGLQVTYRHPLADVIGVREAPPIKNGNITKEDTMKAYLESTINSSLNVSVSVDFISLPDVFKEAKPNIGDTVKLRDDITGIDNEDVRIVEITTTRDPYGRITKQDVVLGDFRLRERYLRKLNNAANFVSGVTGSGLGGLGGAMSFNNSLDTLKARVTETTKLTTSLVDASTTLDFSVQGATAKNDNGYTGLHENGITYSKDGQNYNVAIDGNGVNTDAIPKATSSNDGIMTKEDKSKLDSVSTGFIMTDTANSSKRYKVTVTNGQLKVQEV